MTQNSLGAAHSKLPLGDRDSNLQRAIDCYEAALQVWTEDDFPDNHTLALGKLRFTQDLLGRNS